MEPFLVVLLVSIETPINSYILLSCQFKQLPIISRLQNNKILITCYVSILLLCPKVQPNDTEKIPKRDPVYTPTDQNPK